jgi:hypothetical protein
MGTETTYIAEYLEGHKDEILDRWRAAAENEAMQAERLAKLDDRELLDHLPALTEVLIGVLRGGEESLVEATHTVMAISAGSTATASWTCSGN